MKGNTVSIVGNVTRDAEVKRTQSGRNSVRWGIAWNSSRKNDEGQWVDVPHFFDVECWMSDAQLNSAASGIAKGAKCAIVDGHLEYQSWTDGEGNKRSKVVVRVDDPIQGLLLGARAQRQDGSYQPNAQQGGYGQPQGYGYGQQPPAAQVQGYGQRLPQPQGYGYEAPAQQVAQVPAQPMAQQVAPSLYDEDIPF